MSKICAKSLAALLAVAGASVAVASESAPRWYINPALGFFSFDEDRGLDDDSFLALGLEHRYGQHWAVELSATDASPDSETGVGEVDINQYSLDGLYYFAVEDSAVEPFALLGLAHAQFDSGNNTNNETQINAGLGLRMALSPKWSVRTMVRAIYGQVDDTLDSAFTLGLSYALGGAKAQPKPMPMPQQPAAKPVVEADSDRDGVVDRMDRCAATPAGVSVDASGCPLDSDRDGVADYRDQCPSTPAGRAVDEQGCKYVLKRTEQISLQVKFATNSAQVADESLPEIERVAAFLRKYGEASADIEGHTDSRGSAAYNKSLSQRRADAVKQVLVERYGIAASRLTAIGYGEERLVASEDTAEGLKANRRVVAVFKAEVEE